MKRYLSILLVLTFALGLVPQAVTAAPVLQGVACDEDVVVQADDWLSKLADKFYGDVLAFPVLVEATNQAHDAPSFEPMVTTAKQNLRAAGERRRVRRVVADAGYWSVDNVNTAGVEVLAYDTRITPEGVWLRKWLPVA